MVKKSDTTKTKEEPNAVIKVNKKMTEELINIIKKYNEIFTTVPEGGRVCGHCKKNKTSTHYFSARNPLMYNRKIGICKDCIETVINFEEYGEAQYFLTLMGLPFVEDAWEKCLQDPLPIGKYIKLMNLGQYASLEAATINRIKSYSEAFDNDPYQAQLDTLTNDEKGFLKAKWGEHYSLIDCIKLEEYAEAMMEDYDIDTRSHQDYLQKIAKVSLIIDNMIRDGDYDGVKKMSKTLDDLMKSAGFTQSTKKENKEDNSFNSFALLFEMAEKQGFIPQYHIDEPKDIVDKTMKNLQSWTYQLITKEPDLQVLLEHAAKRVLEQEKKDIKEKDEYEGLEGIDYEYNEKT
jgi:hypothetical protein